MDKVNIFRDLPSENLVTGGHSLCAGCGPAIGLRLSLLAILTKFVRPINLITWDETGENYSRP